MEILYSKLA